MWFRKMHGNKPTITVVESYFNPDCLNNLIFATFIHMYLTEKMEKSSVQFWSLPTLFFGDSTGPPLFNAMTNVGNFSAISLDQVLLL